MKKTSRIVVDDMRREYDFGSMKGGVRGKYAHRARESTNIVVIEPEVAETVSTEGARAVRRRGGLPNKALQPGSRAPRKASTRRRSRASRLSHALDSRSEPAVC
jgi:hypothetical protein